MIVTSIVLDYNFWTPFSFYLYRGVWRHFWTTWKVLDTRLIFFKIIIIFYLWYIFQATNFKEFFLMIVRKIKVLLVTAWKWNIRLHGSCYEISEHKFHEFINLNFLWIFWLIGLDRFFSPAVENSEGSKLLWIKTVL